MKVKVLKDYVCKTGRIRHHGDVVEMIDCSPTLPGLMKLGFVEPISIDLERWEKDGIKSKLTNLIIAPEDYTEYDKKHFTFDEALEIEKKLGNGWRLPTRSEWVLICEEFGQKDGLLDRDTLAARLYLKLNGYKTTWNHIYDAGTHWNYWSRTPNSSSSAYFLNSYSGGFNPGTSYNPCYLGFSVRCVKEVEK